MGQANGDRSSSAPLTRARAPRAALVIQQAVIIGGTDVLFWHLVRHGRDVGIEWVVIFLEDGPLVEQARALGLTVHVVPAGRMRQPHRLVGAALSIRRIVRQEAIECVVGWTEKGQLYAGLAAAFARTPSVWYQHIIASERTPLQRGVNALPARGIMTSSRAVADVQKTLWPAHPTHVVYPAVDTERFTPALLEHRLETRRRFGIPEDRPVVGLVARLIPDKGVHVLMEAVALVRERHPDLFTVVVAGPAVDQPDYPAYIDRLIRTLGLQDSVLLAGFQQDVPAWMSTFDICTYPTRYESFGMVVIEAMALGLPVIAGRTGGVREIISSGTDGILVSAEDHGELAAAISQCLDEPSFSDRLGSAAHQRAMDFSMERYLECMLAALDRFVPELGIGRRRVDDAGRQRPCLDRGPT